LPRQAIKSWNFASLLIGEYWGEAPFAADLAVGEVAMVNDNARQTGPAVERTY
jgi:hypothetical protein